VNVLHWRTKEQIIRCIYFRLKMVVRPKHVSDKQLLKYSCARRKPVVYYFIQIICYMFRSYDHLQPGNLNKIVNNYWNRLALDGNPWTWSYTRNRMQTPKSISVMFNKRIFQSTFPLWCIMIHWHCMFITDKNRSVQKLSSVGRSHTDPLDVITYHISLR
jgi:hypothetical protein